MSATALIKQFIPPILLSAARRRRPVAAEVASGVRLTGNYESWDDAVAATAGYEDPALIERVVDRNLADFKRFEAGDLSVSDRDLQIFFALQVAIERLRVAGVTDPSVADYGGELGQFAWSLSRFMDPPPWTVIETPAMVAAGVEHFSGLGVTFSTEHPSIRPKIALASGVLQAVKSPDALLNTIRAPITLLSIVPFIDGPKDVLTARVVHGDGYTESYPLWMLSEQAWRTKIALHHDVVLEWTVDKTDTLEDGRAVRYVGMLLEHHFKGPDEAGKYGRYKPVLDNRRPRFGS
jgi:putative methyltransferase (TIGR04325 family)